MTILNRQLALLPVYRILLALILLFGQTVSVLHAHELDEHQESATCHICLHSQSHDVPLFGDLSLFSTEIVKAGALILSHDQFRPSRVSTAYNPRAPPFFSYI